MTTTITLGGNLETSGAFNLTQTLTGNTNVTFPTSGTLATTSDLIKYNLVYGGNFDTNPWQRGTSFTSAANNQFTADRFKYSISTVTGVVNFLKTADAPTVAQAGIFSQYCLHLDVTTADSSISAGDFYTILYKMEGYDWSQLAQRAFTFSFWVKSTKTGTFCISFVNDGADQSYVAEYTINASDTWEMKTINVPASPSSGTWNYTNGTGIQIYFVIAMGSNFHGTSGSWQASGIYSSANQVNGMDSTANNFKLQLIKIEPGIVATPFTLRPFDEELQLCLRYYQTWGGTNTDEPIASGFINTTSQGTYTLHYQSPMRAAPTLSISAASDFKILYQNTNSTATAISLGGSSAGLKSATLVATPTGTPLTAGEGSSLVALNTNARLNLSSEL